MIIPLMHIPDKLKDYNALYDHTFFELLDNNCETYGYAFYYIVKTTCFFHFVVGKWSHNVLKEAKIDFCGFKILMKAQKIEEIIVTYTNIGDERMYKLLCEFGFSEPKYTAISAMRL